MILKISLIIWLADTLAKKKLHTRKTQQWWKSVGSEKRYTESKVTLRVKGCKWKVLYRHKPNDTLCVRLRLVTNLHLFYMWYRDNKFTNIHISNRSWKAQATGPTSQRTNLHKSLIKSAIFSNIDSNANII